MNTRIVKLVSGQYAVQAYNPFAGWLTVAKFKSLDEARSYRRDEFANEVECVIE